MLARRAIFVLLIALACAPSWPQTEITIGTGTGTAEYPLETAFQDTRTQVIYLEGQIRSAYKITALSLDVTAIPGQTMNNFTVRMRHTTFPSYPSPASWESTGWTIVYQANETITTTGWRKFTFTTPFEYNGVDSLMVDFSFNNDSAGRVRGYCHCSVPGGVPTLYYWTNGTYGDPLTWSGTTPTGWRTSAIPNIKLEVVSVATPSFFPYPGSYSAPQDVMVSCETFGATMHYTTNGIDPTESDAVVSSGHTVRVVRSCTLKAKAWKTGLIPSPVKSADYLIATKTIYVKPTGNNSNNGLSWAAAKRTVQAGINTAGAGDEVWVAAGVYIERITLKADVAVYGGFTGTETSRSQRNWNANVTVLDGNRGGSVVTSPTGANYETVIDGFTIRNGRSLDGSGIYCLSSSPLIAHNTITGNSTTGGDGGGIYCDVSASPTITNNLIAGNSAYCGGAIHCDSSSSPAISNNTITGNSASASGGAVYCRSSSPTISNNTIVGNTATSARGGAIDCSYCSPTICNNNIAGNGAFQGGGISCWNASPAVTNNTITGNNASDGAGIYAYAYSSPVVSNNIIAFNSSGLYKLGASWVLKNNCVYNPNGYNYSGLSPGTGDISADPKLVAWEYGQVHIQSDSPCRDAGDDSAVQPGWADMDGQVRIQGAHVDIGADESDGTVWTFTPVIVRVNPSGNDANDGSSWALAKRTVQAGLNAASTVGGEVWVAAGTYYERIVLPPMVHLFGGFAGTETTRSERNWTANVTVLDGSQGGSVVTSTAAGFGLNSVDGFTIRNGKATNGGGVYCTSSPTIANSTISANSASDSGAGIWYSGSSKISNCVITANRAVGNGGGIYCSGRPKLSNNMITANSATYGGGMYCAGSAVVSDNTIAGNGASLRGGGIYCPGSAVVANNTITRNESPAGGGVYCLSSSAQISNNILAFNSSGLYSTVTPSLKNNCVYNPQGYNYSGVSPGIGDMSADPKLVSWEHGQVHIQSDSPCRDAGDDSAVQPGWVDIDGQARIQGAHVDIGADESDGTVWTFTPLIVRVSPSGNDTNDGSSWDLAKRTVQAGLDAASSAGGEVWVAAGRYTERITLPARVFLFGGFAGGETYRGERNWIVNTTVLDGYGDAGAPAVTSTAPGFALSCVDGFTIRGGFGSYGGGVCCLSSSPSVRNNTITANGAWSGGGGVYCSLSSPTIVNNTIKHNSSLSWGAGIYCTSSSPIIANNVIAKNNALGTGGIYLTSSSPTIMNNTISDNSGPATCGGIYCTDYSSPTIWNNILAFNSSGIHNGGTGAPALRNNCVYGNASYNYSKISAGAGDMSLDPMFVDSAADDYHLLSTSPCIDTGTSTGAPSTDFDGFIRPQDGNGDGTAICDIGAFEFPLSPSLARKNYADGASLVFGCASVTAKFSSPGCIYVENLDRSSGVRIDTSETLSENALVNVQGTMQTDPSTGERYVQALSGWPQATGGQKSLRALVVPGKSIGGGACGLQAGVWSWQKVEDVTDPQWMAAIGLNNIGLLVTVFGNVTFAGTGEFWVDDGSNLDDGSGHLGVKISAQGLSVPSSGFAWVTGISSCEKKGDDLVRLIRATQILPM